MSKCEKVNVTSSPVKSFWQTLDFIKLQVGYSRFLKDPDYNSNRIEELCKIIAEIYCLTPETPVTIDGEELNAGLVQDIYSELDERHIAIVYDQYSKIDYEIKHKKTYLRTMLYNTAFEMEHHYENEFNSEAGK